MKSSVGVAVILAILLSLGWSLAAEAPSRSVMSVALPPARHDSETSVERALSQRRSVRRYGERALSLAEVAQTLWSAQGITSRLGGRTAPSAGALYPIEVYLVAGKVDGLDPGVYHYRPKAHALRRVRAGDVRSALGEAALGQEWVSKAPASLVIAAVHERTRRKYGSRAERYVDIEVGCVCQSAHLQCETLGLGTVAVGAFDDTAVARIIGESPAPLLIMPIGPKE